MPDFYPGLRISITGVVAASEPVRVALGLAFKGEPGLDSTEPGPRGLSAYDVALEAGFVGSESEWLASLSGTDGESVTVHKFDDEAQAEDFASVAEPHEITVLV